MEQQPGRIERPQRNMLIDPMATIEAMAQVEGPAWMREQDTLEKGAVSEGDWELSLQNALERIQKGIPAKVNGRGGFNRWYIGPDGTVSFSEQHAESHEVLQKARELGFVIVP